MFRFGSFGFGRSMPGCHFGRALLIFRPLPGSRFAPLSLGRFSAAGLFGLCALLGLAALALVLRPLLLDPLSLGDFALKACPIESLLLGPPSRVPFGLLALGLVLLPARFRFASPAIGRIEFGQLPEYRLERRVAVAELFRGAVLEYLPQGLAQFRWHLLSQGI